MSKKPLVIQHDLSKLDATQLAQYLRDVSEFIGLDPDLNGLDTIWMDNETGPGKSLVVYARRGTAEILRNKLGIEVVSLTNQMIKGSIVFTATGKANGVLGSQGGRQEIATGSKSIDNLVGKQLDDAIMTASTRALRRLTMQFTSLGILDESEVRASVGDTSNPASNAQPVGAPIVFPAPQVAPNNAPGKDVTGKPSAEDVARASMFEAMPKPTSPAQVVAEGVAALAARSVGQTSAETSTKADIKADTVAPAEPVTPAVAPVTGDTEADNKAAKPKRARRTRNTVLLEGPEPEVISSVSAAVPNIPKAADFAPLPVAAEAMAAAARVADGPVIAPPPAAPAVAFVPGTTVPSTEFEGKPSEAQMGEYRKKVSIYTSELPSSENMGSVQKMRAFITKMSGSAPQFMTTEQWQEQLAFFESFVEKNKIKGLVTYINDVLGVK